MNFRTAFLLPLLLIAIHPNVKGEEKDAKEVTPRNGTGTYKIVEGLSLPNCIEYQWLANDMGKLPKSIKFTNPFLEPLHISATVHGPPCATLNIEYYDSYLKEWRRPVPIPGSSGGKTLVVKTGESVVLPVEEGFWSFIHEGILAFRLEDPVRIRLAYTVEVVSLRSAELRWNRANKKVVDNPLPRPEPK